MISTQISGAGIGLRAPHISHLLNYHVDDLWLELLADNWFAKGGLDLTIYGKYRSIIL